MTARHQLYILISSLFVCAAIASLIARPLPSELTVTCALFGAIAAVVRFAFPDELPAQCLAAFALIAAAGWAPEAARRLVPGLVISWWQPALIAVASANLIGVAMLAYPRRSIELPHSR